MSHEMTEEEDPEQQLDEDSLPQMELVENTWSLVLMQTVNTFRLNGIGCDVMLVSEEGSPLEAHSLILKAGSPYFKQVQVPRAEYVRLQVWPHSMHSYCQWWSISVEAST